MSLESKLLTFENPVFRGYLTHATILVLKMMLMAYLTGRKRLEHRVYPSTEDVNYLKSLKGDKEGVFRHDEVERVRRAHRNDMENIPIFFMAALAYLLTDPSPAVALNLFRIFTICRCAHTFVYVVYVIPQPARGLAWAGAYAVTGYMAGFIRYPTTAAHEWINEVSTTDRLTNSKSSNSLVTCYCI